MPERWDNYEELLFWVAILSILTSASQQTGIYITAHQAISKQSSQDISFFRVSVCPVALMGPMFQVQNSICLNFVTVKGNQQKNSVFNRPVLPGCIYSSLQSTLIREGPHTGQRRVSVRISQTASGEADITLQTETCLFLNDIITPLLSSVF